MGRDQCSKVRTEASFLVLLISLLFSAANSDSTRFAMTDYGKRSPIGSTFFFTVVTLAVAQRTFDFSSAARKITSRTYVRDCAHDDPAAASRGRHPPLSVLSCTCVLQTGTRE